MPKKCSHQWKYGGTYFWCRRCPVVVKQEQKKKFAQVKKEWRAQA